MKLLETAEQTAARCAREMVAALQRGRVRIPKRYGFTIGDVRVTIAAKKAAATVDESPDLPPALRFSPKALKDAYRALCDIRAEYGPDAVVLPTMLVERLNVIDPDTIHSVHTVNHSLSALRARRVAWWHPGRRWLLGCEQPALPLSTSDADGPTESVIDEYRERMAGAGVRRFFREGAGAAQRIWVPGERSDYGVVVTCAESEREFAEQDRTGEIRVRTSSGRLRTRAAVHAELVRVTGHTALVKLPCGERITVQVLGDWHLAGRQEPEPPGCVA